MRRSAMLTWGSTPSERAMEFPCDRHVPEPDETAYRAVDVHAPAAVLFRWLCQMKVAPYSYDWIDNLGRRSPRELTPGAEELKVGQRFMTICDLVEFERDRHITLMVRRQRFIYGDAAETYLIVARGPNRCRLVVKWLARGPGGRVRRSFVRRALPWLELMMTRRQLLTLKKYAEEQASAAPGSS